MKYNGYDVKNYVYVDERFGTLDDFKVHSKKIMIYFIVF